MRSWLRRSQPQRAALACSFCGRSEHEVTSLVAGPRVYICDTCIDACSAIIAAERSKTPSRPLARLYRRFLDHLGRDHRRQAQAARLLT